MIELDKYTDIELLSELLKRNKIADAAHKTIRMGVYYESIIGVGKDNIACITLSKNAFDILEDYKQ